MALLAFAAYSVLGGGSGSTAAGAAIGGNAGTELARSSTSTQPPPQVASTRFAFRAGPGSTWLKVRKGSATGKVLYAHVLAAGSHIKLSGRKLWVTAGAPWNLSVKANGHPLAVPSKVRGHLLVTRTGVRAVA